ncbi:MAG: hypothetical protein IJE89_05350 [Bacilli bacterium]|nr:hypothetical protein [Bacilli bacterium]
MKKIYTFTLESDEYPSEKFNNTLKLVAYMLYMEIYTCDEEDYIPLVINNKINSNNFKNDNNYNGYNSYNFEYDMVIDGKVYYEPFIIGTNSFGFTVIDERIDEETIRESLEYVLRLLNLNYRYTINTVSYEAVDMEDEKNRKKAISHVFENLGVKMENPLVLKLIKSIRSINKHNEEW